MRYQLLGHSGLRVSAACLGTMTFGEEWGWGASKDEARKIYDAFREAGGNFIDTANVYTNGTSETFLGEFVQGHRGEVVLATKYTNAAAANDANAGGNHRKSMMQAAEQSLGRLRTDYIDLYWMHIWDQITPLEEVIRGFDDLVRQGKILYAGVSDAPAWWVSRANAIAELRGWTAFIALQIEYSLIERTVERELIPMADTLGLGVTAWSPLAGGLLSGKYASGKSAGGRYDNEAMRQFVSVDDRSDRSVAALVAAAKELGRSPAQIALAWLRHRSRPVIPIIGARKLEQLKDNLAAMELKLPLEIARRLDEVSRVDLGFPHEFYRKEMVRNFVFGGMRDRIDA
jgi:aryl-alcohol dehydrogenase-like predicted oxidoreductase